MKIDLKNIKLTKEQQQNLAAAIILTGLALFAYFKYWYGPLVTKANEKAKVLEQKKKELKDARAMVAQYAQFQQQQFEINSKLDYMNKRLPKGVEFSEVISEIQRQAAMANINMMNYWPEKEYNRGEYKETELAASFETNFKDLGKFLTGIGYVERMIAPTKLRINIVDKQPDQITGPGIKTMRVETTFVIYSYNE